MEPEKVVYAIGHNIVSALGATTAENVDNVLAEKTGIGPQNDPTPLLAQQIGSEVAYRATDGLHYCGYTYLEQLMIGSATQALSQTPADPTAEDVLFIISSTKGNVKLLASEEVATTRPIPEGAFLHTMARRIATHFGAANQPVVVSNACISGVLAQVVALRLLKAGRYSTAIVIGGDLLSEFVTSGFESFKSVSAKPCKPYDAHRDGLSMGEGVATLVLTTKKEWAPEGAIMLAGGASSNDANHISGPSRTGDGLYFAIRSAMQEAGVAAADVDLIDAHGTATAYNDEMESKAIGLAGMNSVPLLSLKGYFGHTLGASGLLETVVCIEVMKRGIRPRTLGFETLGVPVDVNVCSQTTAAPLKTVVKTASGFGGCNAALVLSTKKAGAGYAPACATATTARCAIRNQQVVLNGETAYQAEDGDDYGTFIRNAFKHIAQPYMKLPKMDDQCKLALTATEYLLKDADLAGCGEEDVALLLATEASSLDTDLRHQDILNSGELPSPAVFVYTLANIMQGEICIRHKLKGENLCLVGTKADSRQLLCDYAGLLLANGRAKKCIAGYASYLQGTYEADLQLIEKKD